VQSLFLLRTGWTPEEVLHLKNTDIEVSDTGFRVATTKKRASTSRHRELSSPARNDTDWGWNPGDLLRRAAHTMQPVKTHSIGSSDFWVGALSRPYYRSRNVTLPAWLSTLPASPQFTFATLVNGLGLLSQRQLMCADCARPTRASRLFFSAHLPEVLAMTTVSRYFVLITLSPRLFIQSPRRLF